MPWCNYGSAPCRRVDRLWIPRLDCKLVSCKVFPFCIRWMHYLRGIFCCGLMSFRMLDYVGRVLGWNVSFRKLLQVYAARSLCEKVSSVKCLILANLSVSTYSSFPSLVKIQMKKGIVRSTGNGTRSCCCFGASQKRSLLSVLFLEPKNG